jgi:hypothetical protein
MGPPSWCEENKTLSVTALHDLELLLNSLVPVIWIHGFHKMLEIVRLRLLEIV